MGDSLNNASPEADDAEQVRVVCPFCSAMVLQGARKCRSCRKWLIDPPRSRTHNRGTRSLTLIVAAVVTVGAVLISQRKSPVGDAPPLTPLTASPTADAAQGPGAASKSSNEPQPQPTPVRPGEPARLNAASKRTRQTRTIQLDEHPLDLVFRRDGKALYVSGNDASLREYRLATGKIIHMASMPAQGDRLRLLNDRYLALICREYASHIPLMDTEHWEKDPTLLFVGMRPADIIALPDRKTAVAASSVGKRLGWFDLNSGRRLADIRLPHATKHLFVVRAYERPYVGAMGVLYRAGHPAGAWMDLFDPAESPFGATRRSISVGREPRPGAVTRDGSSVFFADRVSNLAALLGVDATTELRTVAVGQSPVGAFILGEDRYGITINSEAGTATVVDLKGMRWLGELMLAGPPGDGATAPDGSALFVSLGGTTRPPTGSGAAIIAGDPPQVVATLKTGRGASRVAVSKDSSRAAVANYWTKTITVIHYE